MKTIVLTLILFSYTLISVGQEFSPDELKNVYNLLSIQTDNAIENERYEMVVLLENAYRFFRELPVNDSIDCSPYDKYFKAVALNKENKALFPPFIIGLDESPKPYAYSSHTELHMVLDTTWNEKVNVLVPDKSVMNDFNDYLNEINSKNYLMMVEDYKSLLQIKNKIETYLSNSSLKIAQPRSQNKVMLVNPKSVEPVNQRPPVKKQILDNRKLKVK